MFRIDRMNNITISIGDNAIFNVDICGDTFKDGDKIIFKSPEQETTITEFNNGTKIPVEIASNDEAVNGTYCIRAIMKDGRNCLLAEGKFIRKGGC